MLIGVVSDTHRDETALKKVVEEIKNLDVVIHLGDNVADAEEIKDLINNKIVYVKGNCDIMANEPTELIEEFHGVRILITHGHKYNVKNTLTELKYRAQQLEADIALFGHTHISEISFEDGIWLINPGSAALPRDGHRSIAIICIEDGEISPSIKLI